jgi:hypothetical protein
VYREQRPHYVRRWSRWQCAFAKCARGKKARKVLVEELSVWSPEIRGRKERPKEVKEPRGNRSTEESCLCRFGWHQVVVGTVEAGCTEH